MISEARFQELKALVDKYDKLIEGNQPVYAGQTLREIMELLTSCMPQVVACIEIARALRNNEPQPHIKLAPEGDVVAEKDDIEALGVIALYADDQRKKYASFPEVADAFRNVTRYAAKAVINYAKENT